MNGWIKIHRNLLEWEWYDDINTKTLFIHILLRASHKEDKWHGINIKKGQLLTSYEHLAKETGLTVQNVRTSLTKLKSTGEITTKSTSKYTIIQVQNWDKHQIANTQINTQTNKQLTNNQHATNNRQEVKNIYNDKKYLINLPIDDVNELAKKFNISPQEVSRQAEAAHDYCLSQGKTYRDYRAFLRNWLRNGYSTVKEREAPKGQFASYLERLEGKS